MRQWWRRSGRNQQFPVDGVSGATKPAGKHALAFNGAAKPLAQLKPGQYAVVVEAAREVGGRELLRILPMAAAEGRTAERAASMSWAPSRWT